MQASATLSRHVWDKLTWDATRLVKSCEYWGSCPNRTISVLPYVNGKRDLKNADGARQEFEVPELASVGYPTRFALTIDALTGLASVFLA